MNPPKFDDILHFLVVQKKANITIKTSNLSLWVTDWHLNFDDNLSNFIISNDFFYDGGGDNTCYMEFFAVVVYHAKMMIICIKMHFLEKLSEVILLLKRVYSTMSLNVLGPTHTKTRVSIRAKKMCF